MTFRPLNVLITHECSGNVCREFRALGHSAWSCDILPRTDGNVTHHILGDGIEAMRRGRPTDGAKWDLVITHHVCRYLANSGALRLYNGGKKCNGLDVDRWAKMRDGAEDFRRQFLVGEYQGPLCAENPVMHCHARELIDAEGIAEANGVTITRQTIQPFQFGEDASKATQLWLRDLPELTANPANYFPPRAVCPKCHAVEQGAPDLVNRALTQGCIECGSKCLPRWSNQTDSGQNKLAPSEHRAATRAITYPGIACAMAEQFSAYLLSK
jgi:hypothetical protein